MWNSYWNGRARRDLPQVNYNESSEEDYDSPLQSPQRPPPTRAGSPVELAVPTLADNVDEELAAVSRTLNNVGHTHTFRGTRPTIRPEPEGVEQVVADEVLEEHEVHLEVVGGGDGGAVCEGNEHVNMPDAVDFEDENGRDGDKAIEYSRTLKLEYNPENVEFWFTQLENEMFTCTIKSQWMKRCILVRNLPPKVQNDVMSLLNLKQTAAPDDIYKQIKNELLRIHAPKCEENFKKALQRVLVGLPSQLGQVLISDICDKPKKLDGCCCAKAVYCLWCLQLPVAVRTHVSTMPFNSTTYNDVFQQADKIFMSTRATELSAGVAAVTLTNQEGSEVAAMKPKNKKPWKGNRGQAGADGGGNTKPNRGPRHKSNPPSSCCDNHYRWGASAWFCLSPASCPWKDKYSARPEKKEKKENDK